MGDLTGRRRSVMASLLAATLALGACLPDAAPSSSNGIDSGNVLPVPSLPEPVRGDGMVTDLATIVVAVQPRWAAGDDGVPMTDDWGENPALLEPPVAVSVLAGPVGVDDADWYQVYVLPNAMRGLSDFVAWVPATIDGTAVLDMEDPGPCPDGEVAALAQLSPAGRLDCFGDRTVRFVARSWLAGHWVPYELEPSWLGTSVEDSRTISLFEPGGTQFPRPPDPSVAWIDTRIPPDVSMPPLEVTLLAEAQFDHPAAKDCRRTRNRAGPPAQPALAGLPDEPPDASVAWCRGQLVLTSWEILLGPEGRPPVAGEVQLHRTSFEGDVCGGVGLPPLRFRVDAAEADPIWLEPETGGQRIIPVFGAGFRAAFTPDLVVLGPDGQIVARDGTPLDPDASLGPYAVCPGGEAVTITAP